MNNLFTSNISEIDIVYKNKVRYEDMRKVSNSRDAFELLREIWSEHLGHREEFMILCLNKANKVLGWSRISSGGLSSTVADPKIIFQVALKANASYIILAHNHPSGNLQPSQQDIDLTKKIVSAGSFLELKAVDHLIIRDDAYYSFADEGLI